MRVRRTHRQRERTEMARLANPEALVALRRKAHDEHEAKVKRISVCGGTGCRAAKASGCIKALKEAVARHNLADTVEVRETGCFGLCERGPIVVVSPNEYFYVGVKAADADEIVAKSVAAGQPIERLMVKNSHGESTQSLNQVPFYSGQQR